MQKVIKYLRDDIDTDIKSPTDYPYMKFLRFNLIPLNSWPGKEIGESSSKYRVLIAIGNMFLQFLYFSTLSLYLKNNFGEQTFFEMGHSYVSLLIALLSLLRAAVINFSAKWKDVIVTYIKTMHLFYYKNGSAYAMKIHKRIHSLANIYTVWLTGQVCGELFVFTVLPVYNNYSSGKYKHKILYNETYEHSVQVQLPFDTDTNIYGYLFLFSLNLIYTYLNSVLMYMVDLLVFIIVFHLWGHYQILLYDLRSFPLPAKTESLLVNNTNNIEKTHMYSEQELNEISKRLRDCIDYHCLITGFTREISAAFGPMIFIFYIWHQVIECVLLVQCSQLTTQAVMLYGPITIIMIQQLIQLSVIFELIGTSSGNLRDGVYGVPWQFMDAKNRKTVSIFLTNVTEPIHVKALGIIKVGVMSMVTIFKTSFSYYCFLRTAYNSKH